MTTKKRQFILDLETAGLPRNSFGPVLSADGRYYLMDMGIVRRNYEHDIYQLGLFDSSTGKTTHTSIVPQAKPRIKGQVGETVTGYEMAGGVRIPIKQYVTRTSEKEEMINFLSKTGKLNRNQVQGYVQSVGSLLHRKALETNFESEENGMITNESKYGFMNRNYAGENRVGGSSPFQDKLNNNPAYQRLGIQHNGIITQEDFSGRGKNSLYEELDNILNIADENPIEIGGWNVGFDIENIRAVLDRNGDRVLLKRFDNAVANGTIELRSIEHEWQQVVYQLSKENKAEMRGAFKIRYRPSAFRDTGGKSGRIANSFVEAQNSTMVFTQQHVAEVLSFTKKIQKAMPGGVEEHIASLDVKLTEATKKTMDDLLFHINMHLPAGRARLTSISDLSKLSSEDKVVTKAFNSLIKANSKYNKDGATVESVIESIVKPAKQIAKFEEEQFGSLYANAINKVSHVSTLLKYGTPVAIGVATLLATYGIGGDERTTTILDRIPHLMNLTKKIFNKQDRHGRVNDTAEKRTSAMKTMALMTMAPIGALYAVGAVTAKTQPKLFHTTKPIQTVEDAINSFFRTVRFGAKRVEKAFPITRIARVSDMTDYLIGDRSYGQMINGNWKGKRWSTITTDAKGPKAGKTRVVTRFQHDVLYEDLLDAAKLTGTDDQYQAIKELFEPRSIPDGVARRIPMVTVDQQGRAVVFGQEYGLNGKLIETNKYTTMWKEGITLDAKLVINDIRHKDIFGKGQWAKRDMTSNAISYLKMQRSLFEKGHVRLNTIEEMMAAKKIIAAPGSYQYFEESMKHLLQIGAKGTGESKNILVAKGSYKAQKTQTILNVRSLGGKNTWTLDNIRTMNKFISPILQNYTIEGMNNFLERPFEFLVPNMNKRIYKYAQDLKSSKGILSQIGGKTLSAIAAPHLGLPMYNIGGGVTGYLGQFALKRILPVAAGFEALRFVDHALGAVMHSPTGRGPLTMLPIRAYEGLSLLYSKLSDITRMTSVAKKQESIAPGSTGLGIFAGGASWASTAYLAGKMFKMAPDTMQNSIKSIALNILKRGGGENLLMRGAHSGVLAGRTPMQKFASWAIRNPAKGFFAAGLMPMIPFLPGFLGSNKSYAERKAEFQGKKEVAIRKNRGWLLSTSPFQGGKVGHFREHAASLISKDWENRGVIWPSYWKRLAHNMTFGMYGKYMLEDYHKEDQPTYQSAPYGNNIPIIGPLIASTVGKFIKPTIDYHKFGIEHDAARMGDMVIANLSGSNSKTLQAFGTGAAFSRNAIDGAKISTDELARHIGLTSENSLYSGGNKFSKSLHDFIGFRGFGYEAIKSSITGLKTPDEFTPYAQSASEFYNTSQQMWNYAAGDVTLFGGEFLRRIFQYPDKRWLVNQIPNEFNGVSWITQGNTDLGKKSAKDLTHGTTFDKIPMGWLHASRKGWELQFPEIKGVDMESYPDPIRVEILKHMSPFSSEFNTAANKVKDLAIGNQLTPEQEQRYYESLQQVGQLKDQLYAYEGEASYNIATTTVEGRVQDVDGTGRFTVDTMAGRTFRLSGVSLDEEDVRARLLKEHSFKDQFELSEAMQSVVSEGQELMSRHLQVGNKIKFDVAAMDQMINVKQDQEAIIGGLNTELISKGAGFVNTGNLAKYNVFQRMNGLPSKVIGKYWDKMTSGESFWINKLKPQRDYLSHYKYSNVFNRDVKLWNHPIEQIVKPMVASIMHKFGVETIPRFTIARRHNQEYWDILKYIKGKMLEVKTGNPLYRDMWKSTMLGADPLNGSHEEMLKALPENERAFFSRFASEPNPKKRGQILKYVPAAQRRIYTTIWAKQRHANSDHNNPEEQKYWDQIKATEGFGITDEEENQYRQETNGRTTRADWKRLKYIEEYAKTNYIPGANDDMWKENVDIDDVELLSLRGDGENIEDYGFFEDKARIAAFDSRANLVAMHLKSQVLTMSSSVGSLVPYISSDYNAKDAQSNPSMTINPLAQHKIQTNGYERLLNKSYGRYIAEMADDVVMIALRR